MDVKDYYDAKLKWAIVGDVLNEEKYAYRILKHFKNKGQDAIGVTPYGKTAETYNTLAEIDYNIEGVNLCISPKRGYNMLLEDNRHNIKCVIAQPGARSEEIKKLCRDRGIDYIETCTLATL